MPVAAAVVSDGGVAARVVFTACNVSAERRRAAAFDRAHHLHLIEADMTAIGITPRGPVIAEDVRDFLGSAGHFQQASSAGRERHGDYWRIHRALPPQTN